MSPGKARWLLFCCLSVALLLNRAYATEELDQRTLCQKNGAKQQTILLIDITDPLPPVAQERLKHLLKAFSDSNNDEHYLKRGHELIVYHLSPKVTALKPRRVCNPGNPEDRTLRDNLLGSKSDAKQKWRRFVQFLQQIFHKSKEQVSENQSPLLETLAVVSARHVSSLGAERKPTRLILFSDMLQHSALLSHYKPLPEMKTFKTMTGYAEMESDLKKADVWLFYVRRTGLENRQTSEHYYWWTQVIELFGGHLRQQVPL